MEPWVVESGTLWALETGNGLPPLCSAQVEVMFREVQDDAIEELASAMNLTSLAPIQERLQSQRRCYCLWVSDQIVSYGWVTYGVECVGELERKFYIHENEAYIWDCGTVLAWRGQHFYSALLSHMIHQLYNDGVQRIWIGASRQNQPSIKGFTNAGFQPIVDCVYGRIYRLTLLWIQQADTAQPPLIAAAYRILLNNHERRLGRLIIGYKR